MLNPQVHKGLLHLFRPFTSSSRIVVPPLSTSASLQPPKVDNLVTLSHYHILTSSHLKMTPSITICIPVFNQYIGELASVLMQQAGAVSTRVEVYFVDDFSEELYKKDNRFAASRFKFRYEELPANIGRAKIRNYMADQSEASHLIFLDGDTVVEHSDFVSQYIDSLHKSPESVYCGGTYFQNRNFEQNKMLHWMYGSRVVANLHSRRDLNGRFHFMSSNFMIAKDIFNEVRFNEDLRDYGHEDTIFGYELRKRDVDIVGVDNAVLHGSLDTTEEFLMKVTHLVENLRKMRKSGKFEGPLSEIRLVQVADNLQKCGLNLPYLWFFEMIKNMVTKNLHGSKPSLRLLNMYKLYLFLKNKG